MNQGNQPLVSVLTPVYNGEKYIAECIRSVLEQTYNNFQYTIVNNCSTDHTLEIAREFAEKDRRILTHNNTEFLNVVANHNKAFSLVHSDSKYCKLVDADDWLFPNCIAEMVRVAEEYPTIGMVTSYVLAGTRIGWEGLPYPSPFTKGRDICRKRFLNSLKVFGGPSASLIRSDIVRAKSPFYSPLNYHGDNDAYLYLLQENDFGFVHQVLSYNRRGEDSRTTSYLDRVNSYLLGDIEELTNYGHIYLTKDELENRMRQLTDTYYKFLVQSILEFRGKEFWSYHRNKTEQLGYPIDYFKLARYLFYRSGDLIFNPKRTIEGIFHRFSKGASSNAQ